jgi:hypothetical protein
MIFTSLDIRSSRHCLPSTHRLGIPKKAFRFRKVVLVAAMLMMWLKASLAFSAPVTLAWDAPTDSSIEGYMVFSRLADQAYDYNAPCWQGSATTCTLSDLDFSLPTYFVVRAYDVSGNMSADSNEAVYNPPQSELDSDGDGMPDEWEIRYGLDTSRNDASEDLDGDLIANQDEFRLGSNPAASSGTGGPAQPEWVSPETGR